MSIQQALLDVNRGEALRKAEAARHLLALRDTERSSVSLRVRIVGRLRVRPSRISPKPDRRPDRHAASAAQLGPDRDGARRISSGRQGDSVKGAPR
jgi:hypothetical protein